MTMTTAETQASETAPPALETKDAGPIALVAKALRDGGLKLASDEPAEVVRMVEKLVASNRALRTKTIDQEVEALVGVKISRAEKDDFVELRTTNAKLFAKMIEGRSENGVLSGNHREKGVLGKDPKPAETAASSHADSTALANMLDELEADGEVTT